jgi:hypothetical protein
LCTNGITKNATSVTSSALNLPLHQIRAGETQGNLWRYTIEFNF